MCICLASCIWKWDNEYSRPFHLKISFTCMPCPLTQKSHSKTPWVYRPNPLVRRADTDHPVTPDSVFLFPGLQSRRPRLSTSIVIPTPSANPPLPYAQSSIPSPHIQSFPFPAADAPSTSLLAVSSPRILLAAMNLDSTDQRLLSSSLPLPPSSLPSPLLPPFSPLLPSSPSPNPPLPQILQRAKHATHPPPHHPPSPLT